MKPWLRILVVDDDPLLKEVLSAALSELVEAQVWATGNGEEAISLVCEHQPDLVLLDLDLPGLSGLEVCERLAQTVAGRRLRVWIMTGMELEGDTVARLRQYSERVVFKPVDFAELIHDIEALGLPQRPSLELLSE